VLPQTGLVELLVIIEFGKLLSLFEIWLLVKEAEREEERWRADPSVTQVDDPTTRRSGGHFAEGMSKTPPGSARERSGVIVYVVCTLPMADGKWKLRVKERRSPITNGLTAVGGANTKLRLF